MAKDFKEVVEMQEIEGSEVGACRGLDLTVDTEQYRTGGHRSTRER